MLDDIANPYLYRRQSLGMVRYVRNVIGIALSAVIVCNIALFLGVSGAGLHLLQGVRISLGLCLATAFSGTILGFFIACITIGPLPYLIKLPVASLAGMLIVNSVVLIAQLIPLAVTIN